MTCVFTNSRAAGQALLQKESIGGTGTFDLDVTPPPGADVLVTSPVTTTAEGVPVTVASAEHPPPGHYGLSETVPAPDGTGYWETPTAFCDGTELPVTLGPATPEAPNGTWLAGYDLAPDTTASCLLTNRFVPGGHIGIEKVTRGGTGTFRYVVQGKPVPRAGRSPIPPPQQSVATTTAEDTPATAVRADGSPGPAATLLPVGPLYRYSVQELLPAPTADGWWALESVDCGQAGSAPDLERALVEVLLTAEDPTPTCRFTNRFHRVTRLDVVKLTTDDTALRPLAARLELRCTGDESPAALLVDPGRPRADLGRMDLHHPDQLRPHRTRHRRGHRHRHRDLRRPARRHRRHRATRRTGTGVHRPGGTLLDGHRHQPADPPVALAVPEPLAEPFAEHRPEPVAVPHRADDTDDTDGAEPRRSAARRGPAGDREFAVPAAGRGLHAACCSAPGEPCWPQPVAAMRH